MAQDILEFRRAEREDLPAIIALLKDDELGSSRESESSDDYIEAFEEIRCDSSQMLIVAFLDEVLVGTVQVSILRHLSRRGARRAQLESVRVSAKARRKGVGKRMISYVIELARSKGCEIVQLSSDKKRTDAIEFYKSLGFTCSHEGLKLMVGSQV